TKFFDVVSNIDIGQKRQFFSRAIPQPHRPEFLEIKPPAPDRLTISPLAGKYERPSPPLSNSGPGLIDASRWRRRGMTKNLLPENLLTSAPCRSTRGSRAALKFK